MEIEHTVIPRGGADRSINGRRSWLSSQWRSRTAPAGVPRPSPILAGATWRLRKSDPATSIGAARYPDWTAEIADRRFIVPQEWQETATTLLGYVLILGFLRELGDLTGRF